MPRMQLQQSPRPSGRSERGLNRFALERQRARCLALRCVAGFHRRTGGTSAKPSWNLPEPFGRGIIGRRGGLIDESHTPEPVPWPTSVTRIPIPSNRAPRRGSTVTPRMLAPILATAKIGPLGWRATMARRVRMGPICHPARAAAEPSSDQMAVRPQGPRLG